MSRADWKRDRIGWCFSLEPTSATAESFWRSMPAGLLAWVVQIVWFLPFFCSDPFQHRSVHARPQLSLLTCFFVS